MVRVGTGFSTSPDGFIAGPNDGPERPLGEGAERLFACYFGVTHLRFRVLTENRRHEIASDLAGLTDVSRSTFGRWPSGVAKWDGGISQSGVERYLLVGSRSPPEYPSDG